MRCNIGYVPAMLSILIPTRNDEDRLARMLPALVSHAVSGAVCEVMVIDDRSDDDTQTVAEIAGCTVLSWVETDVPKIAEGARGVWLLVIEPGARLTGPWLDSIEAHINAPTGAGAARFRHARMFVPATRPAGPFSRGFLISRAQAMAIGQSGMVLSELPNGLAVRTLKGGVIAPSG